MEGDEKIMDIMTKGQRTHVMRSIGREKTAPEKKLARWLSRQGVDMAFNVKGLPGSPDIVIKEKRVAVFVDGCFWHGCPEHYKRPMFNQKYWDKKLEGNKERDRKNDVELVNLGWKVLRFWAHEIVKESKREIMRRIKKEVKN